MSDRPSSEYWSVAQIPCRLVSMVERLMEALQSPRGLRALFLDTPIVLDRESQEMRLLLLSSLLEALSEGDFQGERVPERFEQRIRELAVATPARQAGNVLFFALWKLFTSGDIPWGELSPYLAKYLSRSQPATGTPFSRSFFLRLFDTQAEFEPEHLTTLSKYAPIVAHWNARLLSKPLASGIADKCRLWFETFKRKCQRCRVPATCDEPFSEACAALGECLTLFISALVDLAVEDLDEKRFGALAKAIPGGLPDGWSQTISSGIDGRSAVEAVNKQLSGCICAAEAHLGAEGVMERIVNTTRELYETILCRGLGAST
uniref:Uncharacterized protein n=1 Tax=Alexandrium monilatum TaxID=311494 RepID=A0A7S4WDT6_9DINO